MEHCFHFIALNAGAPMGDVSKWKSATHTKTATRTPLVSGEFVYPRSVEQIKTAKRYKDNSSKKNRWNCIGLLNCAHRGKNASRWSANESNAISTRIVYILGAFVRKARALHVIVILTRTVTSTRNALMVGGVHFIVQTSWRVLRYAKYSYSGRITTIPPWDLLSLLGFLTFFRERACRIYRAHVSMLLSIQQAPIIKMNSMGTWQ